MKVAFDENIPPAMVRVFQLFQKEKQLQSLVKGLEIEKAQQYYPKIGDLDYLKKNDAPWIRKFKAAGGKVIISGDAKMKTVPHERLALVEEKLIVFFFQPQWSDWQFCAKCSLLLHWWPEIIKKAKTAKAPKFYNIPSSWSADAKIKSVPTKDQKLIRVERQKAARPRIAAKRKAMKEAEERAPTFDFGVPNEPKSRKRSGRKQPDAS